MKHIIFKTVILIFVALAVYACANKAQGPTGGPKDETPPRVMRSTPPNGALNFKKKEIQIIFDENITIEKPNESILISPPQAKQPDVKGNAKLVSVIFEDSLIQNTTYTISFGNSIVDLNEKNPLKDYRFSFSTGNEIDTLKISGILINAQDLNPVSDAYIGIYADNNDSIFFQKPFLRIAKTNENGAFTIANCKAGKYKIYALGDANKDYMYQPGENLAFIDSLVNPFAVSVQKQDTIWKDSTKIDTIKTIFETRFLPDNILLKYFKESTKRQYFVKSERKFPHMFSLYFNTANKTLPALKPLGFKWENAAFIQKNNTLDTLNYWIRDSSIYKMDTLQFELSYLKTDSLFNLKPQTDTIQIINRNKPIIKQKTKNQIVEPVFYKINSNGSSSFDIYNPLLVQFESPLDTIQLDKVKLFQKLDSTFKPLKFKWQMRDSSQMNYIVNYKWEADKEYKLVIDSAGSRNIYGLINKNFEVALKIKSLDEYSALKIKTEKYDSLVVFQLLSTTDQVIASKKAAPKGVLFEYLKPGDYYVRAYIDTNKNELWDTGNFSKKQQPEEVYYYSKKLSLKANWEFEETWNLNELPLLQQKPAELKKDANKKQGN